MNVEPIDPLKKDKKPELPKEWHQQQAKLLKSWAEIASSYRWMHNQAYMIYKKKNLYFMIPLIIMSTVAGTANFAQTTFPESIRPYVPQMIGAINLIAAIMTTIYQFLKISEFMESHRISSINYGKLARTLTVELSLPIKDRTTGGAECVKMSRTEIDRLIEQSPAIPKHVLAIYEKEFTGKGLSEPEIVVINNVDIYEDKENIVAVNISEAGVKFKSALQKLKKPLFPIVASNSPTEKRRENVNNELNQLQGSKLVSMVDTKSLNNIINRFQPVKKPIVKQEPIVFTPPKEETEEIIDDIVNDMVESVAEQTTEPVTEQPVEQSQPTEPVVESSDVVKSVSDLIKSFKR
jgi:hypothetical protein